MQFLNPIYILAILIALTVHEWAHAFTADRLGDPTPDREGRLTLNPLAHLDPLGALMFLVVGFGWARPVPVNPSYFRRPKQGMALVAAAGPLSNLIMGFLAFVALLMLSGDHALSAWSLLSFGGRGAVGQIFLQQFLRSFLFINLALMAFNLLPVAPLDGSNILRLFIPYHQERRYEEFFRYGPYILLFLILFESFLPVPIVSGWVHGIMNGMLSLFAFLVGGIL